MPFGKPMARTREYIEILRKILKREAPLQHDGELYQIPYKGPGATGLGKPLKSILHGDPSMPIYAASITPIGLKVAGEVADGVLPIFMSPEKAGLVTKPLAGGHRPRARRAGPSPISTSRPSSASTWVPTCRPAAMR